MSDGSGECSMRIGDVGEGDQGIYQIEINYNVPLKKQVYLYMTGEQKTSQLAYFFEN